MIRKVRIENFKSIADLTLELGRVTVLIGANGSGKSNILEAITFASAAAQNKLDNEFLISRGIRVTETRFMRSAFDGTSTSRKAISIAVGGGKELAFAFEIWADETASFPKWIQKLVLLAGPTNELLVTEKIRGSLQIPPDLLEIIFSKGLNYRDIRLAEIADPVPGFLIYSPENSALRTFQSEGQILPLGIRGEGLFAHLRAINSEKHRGRLVKIREELTLIDWFESFDIPENLSPGERSIRIRDRHLPEGALFDQRSANEGFLFLLFYITLFISPDTPAFFSIDNIDTSLNPKLCIALLQQIAVLAKEYDKQVILTTHNPAVLDGLNLHDDEQRLLVVDRNKAGHTRVRRVEPPKPMPGQPTVSLSEAFMRGFIGGLPKNF
jgi:energy-coupling factor transporter ATP-binding protein EcfA2